MSASVVEEAARRRSFAVISHPDAGKSTLTEALALHARAITTAGAIHGKAGRKGTVSDWMAIEKERGISITSAALQFEFDHAVINLVDTPGHADFSEDTYRVLTAVDCAVMLMDAAKGLEPQTMKLYEVCAGRGIPVITFINKWDRPGREALDLLDEMTKRTHLKPAPLTWPVGIAGDFRGVLDRRTGELITFQPGAGKHTIPVEERLSPAQALAAHGDVWTEALEESELLDMDGSTFDPETFANGECSPVLFGCAVAQAGVKELLDVLVSIAPAPTSRPDADGAYRKLDAPFSGVVFKVQAGMNAQHRDRLAFVRVNSGRFERGEVVLHGTTGRPFATRYAQSVFGADRETVDEAYPGDVVGLVNANSLRVGDTLYVEEPVVYPPLPRFAPEFFSVCRAVDSSRYKQFRRGIAQLDQEGVVQVLTNDLRGEAEPVLAAVGPMQFEVVAHRMTNEFNAPCRLVQLGYSLARKTDRESADALNRVTGVEVLQRSDGVLLALFADKWRMQSVMRDNPTVTLEPLPATTS